DRPRSKELALLLDRDRGEVRRDLPERADDMPAAGRRSLHVPGGRAPARGKSSGQRCGQPDAAALEGAVRGRSPAVGDRPPGCQRRFLTAYSTTIRTPKLPI